MKKTKLTLLCLIAIYSSFAEEEPNIALLSEAYGHIIEARLKYLEIPFDITQLVKGIQDASLGKTPPLSEKECTEAIRLAQEKKFKDLAKKNLKEAECFLKTNIQEAGMIALEDAKVQYQIKSEGTGPVIKSHFVPLIRYKIKTLDGSVLDLKYEEEPVSLDETIIGLKIGLLGMKEGEKRVLYIHPELSYGEKGYRFFPPNSLLIFDIEILKADTR